MHAVQRSVLYVFLAILKRFSKSRFPYNYLSRNVFEVILFVLLHLTLSRRITHYYVVEDFDLLKTIFGVLNKRVFLVGIFTSLYRSNNCIEGNSIFLVIQKREKLQIFFNIYVMCTGSGQ